MMMMMMSIEPRMCPACSLFVNAFFERVVGTSEHIVYSHNKNVWNGFYLLPWIKVLVQKLASKQLAAAAKVVIA